MAPSWARAVRNFVVMSKVTDFISPSRTSRSRLISSSWANWAFSTFTTYKEEEKVFRCCDYVWGMLIFFTGVFLHLFGILSELTSFISCKHFMLIGCFWCHSKECNLNVLRHSQTKEQVYANCLEGTESGRGSDVHVTWINFLDQYFNFENFYETRRSEHGTLFMCSLMMKNCKILNMSPTNFN